MVDTVEGTTLTTQEFQPQEHSEIEFHPTSEGGQQMAPVPALGSFVKRQSSTPGRGMSGQAIPFVGEVNEIESPQRPGTTGETGGAISSVLTESRTLAADESKHVDIAFSPDAGDASTGNVAATTAHPPKMGSFSTNKSSPAKSPIARDIHFSPGGSAMETGPPPGEGSFEKNFSRAASEPEINFSPSTSGADMPTSAPPQDGRFVGYSEGAKEEEKVEIGQPLSRRDIDFCPNDMSPQSGVPPQGSFVVREKPDRTTPPEKGYLHSPEIKATSSSEAYVPSQSIREMEEKLESALNESLDSPENTPKQGNLILPSSSTDSDNLGNSIQKLGALLGSVHQEDILVEDDSDAQDQSEGLMTSIHKLGALLGSAEDHEGIANGTEAKSTSHATLKRQETDATPIHANTEDKDEYIPSESISDMEAMLESVLNDELEDLMGDKQEESKPAEPAKTETINITEPKPGNGGKPDVSKPDTSGKKQLPSISEPGKASMPDDSMDLIDAFLDDTLDNALDDVLDTSVEPSVETGGSSRPQVIQPPTELSFKGKSRSRTARNRKQKPSSVSKPATSTTTSTRESRPVTAKKYPPLPRVAAIKEKKPVADMASGAGTRTSQLLGRPKGKLQTKRTGSGIRRHFMSATSSSRKKEVHPEPQVPSTSRNNGAKKILSRITGWAKKKPKSSVGAAREKVVKKDPVAKDAPTESRTRTKPRPVQLFPGSSKKTKPKPSLAHHGAREKPPPLAIPTLPESITGRSDTSTNSRDVKDVKEHSARDASIMTPGSVSSQCHVESFDNPRRTGSIGCQKKFNPYLHGSKGPCELCIYYLSDEDKAKLNATGRHVRVMYTSGGCCEDCKIFPRSTFEGPARLCRSCFANSHRPVYRKIFRKHLAK